MNNCLRSRAKISSLACLLLCSTSCVARLTPNYFEVLPNSPNYLLQSPDSRQTAFPEVLKAYNGFETGHQWIDLQPLMELRIEDAYYEPGYRRTGLSGFFQTRSFARIGSVGCTIANRSQTELEGGLVLVYNFKLVK
jgi:hypothetical protein